MANKIIPIIADDMFVLFEANGGNLALFFFHFKKVALEVPHPHYLWKKFEKRKQTTPAGSYVSLEEARDR